MSPCEHYIYRQDGNVQKIMLALHSLFGSYPRIQDAIRYTVPFFRQYQWICYMTPRKGGIELVFIHGQQLSNEQGILQTNGRKQVAGIWMSDPKTIPTADIITVWEEALLLDEQLKTTAKKRK